MSLQLKYRLTNLTIHVKCSQSLKKLSFILMGKCKLNSFKNSHQPWTSFGCQCWPIYSNRPYHHFKAFSQTHSRIVIPFVSIGIFTAIGHTIILKYFCVRLLSRTALSTCFFVSLLTHLKYRSFFHFKLIPLE